MIPFRALRSRARPRRDDRFWPLGLWGPADAIGKAIARRVPPASSCMSTTQPGRTSSPPRRAGRLLAWRTSSLKSDESSSAATAGNFVRSGLRTVRAMQSSRRPGETPETWHSSDAVTRGPAIASTLQKSERWRVRDPSACLLPVSTASPARLRSVANSIACCGVARQNGSAGRGAPSAAELGGTQPKSCPSRGETRTCALPPAIFRELRVRSAEHGWPLWWPSFHSSSRSLGTSEGGDGSSGLCSRRTAAAASRSHLVSAGATSFTRARHARCDVGYRRARRPCGCRRRASRRCSRDAFGP